MQGRENIIIDGSPSDVCAEINSHLEELLYTLYFCSHLLGFVFDTRLISKLLLYL